MACCKRAEARHRCSCSWQQPAWSGGTGIGPLNGCPPCQLALASSCQRAPSHLPRLPQDAEGLASELSEVVQQQKLRMRGLAQEKAEACARLQAMNPQVGCLPLPAADGACWALERPLPACGLR